MTSKALAAWTELNDRQQGTLTVIYELDQENERGRRMDAARGHYDKTPAAEWRLLDFAHDPSLRDLLGVTAMQSRLESRGWDNQGNGSTMAALVKRGLVVHGQPMPTRFGRMLRVKLTNHGRAAARAGLSLQPGGKPKNVLPARTWEVLGFLWAAGQRGKPLKWGFSRTIDSLIERHHPPLAEEVPGGYALTDRGREFYQEAYPAHAAAYPGVRAPHPGGADAEPWPPQADEILTRHQQYYRALCAQWQEARAACQQAGAEASAVLPELPGILPAAVAGQAAARHQLWTATARQRADLAAAHAEDAGARAAQAARGYAAAALAAFRAAALRTDPLEVLQPPADAGGWDEQRLAPPAETGIHVIDAGARRLHAAAVGAPLRRRGPAPQRRRRHTRPAQPELPGSQCAALADFLREHTDGGALLRRLHPAT